MEDRISKIIKTGRELIIWLIPPFLAYFGHIYASHKASMSESGPGTHIMLMNELTIETQKLWHFAENIQWIFIVYPILLMIVFLSLRIKKIQIKQRIVVFIIIALPGLLYFSRMMYLGGKLMSF